MNKELTPKPHIIAKAITPPVMRSVDPLLMFLAFVEFNHRKPNISSVTIKTAKIVQIPAIQPTHVGSYCTIEPIEYIVTQTITHPNDRAKFLNKKKLPAIVAAVASSIARPSNASQKAARFVL